MKVINIKPGLIIGTISIFTALLLAYLAPVLHSFLSDFQVDILDALTMYYLRDFILRPIIAGTVSVTMLYGGVEILKKLGTQINQIGCSIGLKVLFATLVINFFVTVMQLFFVY